MKKIFLLAIIAMVSASSAVAAPRWSLIGIGNMAKPTFDAPTFVLGGTEYPITSTISSKTAFGGGLLAEFPLSPRVGFEIGAAYVPKKYEVHAVNTDLSVDQTSTEKYAMLQVPVLFKIWFNRYLGIGLGGYFANGVGQVETTDTEGTTKEGFKDANLKRTDYGLLGSLNIALPLGNSAAFLLGGQYAFGLVDTFEGTEQFKATRKNRDIQAFAGFRFGGGGR